DAARTWLERGRVHADRVGDEYALASLRLGFGELLIHNRDFVPAVEHLRAALLAFRELSAQRMLLETVFSIGFCAVPLGYDQQAVELISACLSLRQDFPSSVLLRQASWVDRFHHQLRVRLGDVTYT